MSNSFSLEQLTEGIRQRHLGSQNVQLVEKWARTGLLRGLDGVHRENMARLMENQASQVLKEQSSLSNGAGGLANSGDMRGFTNIAFPIVRRVFGGLIANDLVSIQPMSLPSGLLFYLDYTRGNDVGTPSAGSGKTYASGESVYNSPAGSAVRNGSDAVGGQYDLAGAGFSRVHSGSGNLELANSAANAVTRLFRIANNGTPTVGANTTALAKNGTSGLPAKLMQFDPQILDELSQGTGDYAFLAVPLTANNFDGLDTSLVKEIGLHITGSSTVAGALNVVDSDVQTGTTINVRRLNQLVKITGLHDSAVLKPADIKAMTPAPISDVGDDDVGVLMVVKTGAAKNQTAVDFFGTTAKPGPLEVTYPLSAELAAGDGSSVVVPAFESNFETSPSPEIPEIDIKVEALPVVAQTRKLRARWSPELAQDLNAYHSLDAEVELTQILSEQIALEIDREVLNDLLTQAGAANYYWSRAPGKFLNKVTGVEDTTPSFTGTVREWYETLVETIIDVANQIHRKTLRGSANFIVVGPDVATILEASVLYKPSYSLDGDGQVSGMVIGAEKVGTLSNRFTVYKDPYFPRNKVLVGYKGGSYLETGYVYAPYVPLIVTPTIFAPEDFTPRKGVMTRYGKKMVRSDFYGTVTCSDMNII